MTIQWDDELLTGIDELDNQHKEMFDRIVKLLNACHNSKGRSEVLNTFSFLEDYVITHFKSEESIMHKCNYINYVSHVAEHQLVIQTNRKVVQWLVSHITKKDKSLAKFIRDQS